MLIAVYLDSVSPNPPMLPAASLGMCCTGGAGPNLMDAAFTTVIARKHYGKEIDERAGPAAFASHSEAAETAEQ
ncbi:hypothetical protein HSBAA_44800 [Vreelandella sulfidaeris]|uniref:Uncharacterized protein n=1 Tax=Vreelandella sulfidaeris TaxID=115553 RepID=A0A455UJS3_9GAMM|nr:hypothetical protein HSBAA_44800 [Halomonas sulfidaeris]